MQVLGKYLILAWKLIFPLTLALSPFGGRGNDGMLVRKLFQQSSLSL
jgi:hypothetical protein